MTAREIFRGIRWFCSSVMPAVLFFLFLLVFGRTPVKGLENISFNPFTNEPLRPALKWGTLLVLVVVAGLVLSHVRDREAISA